MNIDLNIITDFRIWPLGMQAFSDKDKFPDSLLQYALCEADRETGSRRWGVYQAECHNMKQCGMFYYASAWLTTFFSNGIDTPAAGEARLNVASKTVGDESISYRVAAMMDAGNDFLTYTVYGQQFYRLRKRVGMGALAV